METVGLKLNQTKIKLGNYESMFEDVIRIAFSLGDKITKFTSKSDSPIILIGVFG
jgi:hypothetical protein